MKSQKVIALLLSMALSISTCAPLGSITALGAETGVTAQAAAVKETVSESAENAEADEETNASPEAEAADQAAADEAAADEAAETSNEAVSADDREESAEETGTEENDTDKVAAEDADEAEAESAEAEAAESETDETEAADDAAADETEAAVPAQEADSSETNAAEADEKTDAAASEKTAVPAAEQAEEGTAEDSTVITAPGETGTVKTDAQNHTELSSETDFSNAIDINAGDVKDVSITEEGGYALYRFVPTETGAYSFYSSDSSGDPYCYLYNSDQSKIDYSDDDGDGNNFKIKQAFYEGETYYFQACMYSDNTGTYTVHLETADFACSHVGDQERTVSPNEEITLEVSAVSSSAITYQWYDNNSEVIEGAASAAYTFTPQASGSYYCYVSDESGEYENISFSITIDNHLKAWPEGEDEGTDYKNLYVAPNTAVNLSVTVSADDETGLTYAWYKDGETVENANSTTLTTDPVTGYVGYRFQVSDPYGNSRDVYFYIYVENNLKAYPEGEDEDYNSKTIYTAPNTAVDLSVTVSADDETGLTYAWYKDGETVENANSKTLTTDPVTEYVRYQFNVSDPYGNSRDVYFYIYVENNLKAYPEGEDEDTDYKDLYVAPNTAVDLSVTVSADDETGLTYEWYKDYELIENANSKTLTTDPVTGYVEYYFRVSDPYGNSRYVYFYIYVENNLKAYVEGEDEDTNYKDLYVAPNTAVDLSVTVSADDETGLTYEWYKDGELIENANSTALTTDPVTEYVRYGFQVSDPYGNSRNIYFYIYVENNLKAYPEGEDVDYNSKTIYTAPNTAVDLSVIVSADDETGLTYEWYKDGELIENANSTALTTDPVTEYVRYGFQVSDPYGNSQYVYFYIYVENNLKAYVEGEDSNYKYLYVAPKAAVDLSVTVSADDETGLTYAWYKDGETVENANSKTLTTDPVTEYVRYKFNVSDPYGNSRYVYFYIYIENNLKAWPEGEDEDCSSTRLGVEPGASADLNVIVSADDMSQLTYEWRNDDYDLIEDTDGASCKIDSVTKKETYYFTVSDQYGNSTSVYFYVYAENNLMAYPKGSDPYSDSKSIYVMPNDSVELNVVVSADDMSHIACEWYDDNGKLIENADETSYKITSVSESGDYRFDVSDQYGNNKTIYFYIHVDNNLTAQASGGTRYFYMTPGESLELGVTVSADDTSQITYEWYDDNYDIIETAVDSTYTINSVMYNQDYRCEVFDQYGNYAYVYFYIYVNNLSVWPEGEDVNTRVKTMYITSGESVELKVNVSADDMSQITYEWNNNNTAASPSYTTGPVTSSESYECCISDQYGNVEYVYFYIQVNNLKAWPEGEDEDSYSTKIYVANGESAVLKANVSADDMTGISYKWVDRSDDSSITTDSPAYTTDPITKNSSYELKIKDQYGNTQYLYYRVYVQNHLTAYPKGESEDCESADIYVAYGESADLEVIASADDMSQVSYSWYDHQKNKSFKGSSYKTDPILYNWSYECYVEDQYGNSCSVYFNVHVQNNLKVYPEGEAEDCTSTDIYTESGQTASLKAIVSADNESDLSYEWAEYVWNDSYEDYSRRRIGGAYTAAYTTKALEEDKQYRLEVLDTYGNTKTVTFNVSVKNLEKQVISADEEMSLVYGNSGTITVSGAQGALSFESSNPSVASVDSNGKVTANKVGTARITVFAAATDTYNKSNTITVTVTVTGISITNATVSGIENKTYNGSAQTQSPVVKVGSTTLTEGTDYTISYSSNINAGTASMTITGKGSYTGTITKTFTIEKASVTDESVSDIASVTYNGSAQTPDVTVTVNGTVLSKDTDFTVSYKNNTYAGTATATITGTGNYTGTVTKDFTIEAIPITDTDVSDIASVTYNGSAHTPDVTVTVNGTVLSEDTDFTVSYKDNTNAGTAAATITGKGGYSGTVTKNFTIETLLITDADVSDIASVTYNGSEQKPDVTVTVNGTVLSAETDYTVSYENYTNAGTAAAAITGKGNYSGTVTKDFTINPASIESTDVADLDDMAYTGSALQPAVTVTVNGNTLVKDTDYTVSFSNNTDKGTATATITGKGNYTGTVTKNFTITDKLFINDAEVTVEDLTYNGSAQTPVPVVKMGSAALAEGTDFTIESYSDNTNAGTATMTITGTGNYTGTITKEFTINPAQISSAAVSGLTNRTYNGKVQTQTPVVKFGTATLEEGTDYTVSYKNNKNAGTATVTFAGKGNFTGTADKTFKINKAAQSFTVKAAASSIDVGKTTKVTASGAKETTKYTFTSSNTKVATVNAAGTVTGKAAGTVTITVKTAATTNYNAGSKTVKITVNKVLKKPGNCHFVKWNNSKYTSCRIGWNKVAGADGYQTLLSWTDGTHASTTYTKSNVLYRNCTVHPQHVSQMKVRAYYMLNGQRKFGPWSNVEYITPSPTKLTKINKSSGSNLKMFIKWNIIYGCNGYNIFVTTNPNGKWYWNQSTSIKANATSATITKFRGSKLKKNTRYYVRIVTRRKRNGVFCTVPMPASNTYIGSFIIK